MALPKIAPAKSDDTATEFLQHYFEQREWKYSIKTEMEIAAFQKLLPPTTILKNKKQSHPLTESSHDLLQFSKSSDGWVVPAEPLQITYLYNMHTYKFEKKHIVLSNFSIFLSVLVWNI